MSRRVFNSKAHLKSDAYLTAACELMRPSLYSFIERYPEIELDMQPDYKAGAMVVTGRHRANGREASFTITREQIVDSSFGSSWKYEWTPNLWRLFYRLISPESVQKAAVR